MKLLFLLLPILLFSQNDSPYIPWFTGPFLSPTPTNPDPAHPAIQPGFTVRTNYGNYNSNWEVKTNDPIVSINPYLDFNMGITKNIGLEIYVIYRSVFQNGNNFNHFQDTLLFFGYQISNNKKDSWIPDTRLDLAASLPSGKYQKLDPQKNSIDSTGSGSYEIGPLFTVRKLFYLTKNQIHIQGSINYLFPTKVKVKGFNSYGGGYKTRGKVRPGQLLNAFFSAELSLTQRWGIIFETLFRYQQRSTFSGTPGLTPAGKPTTVGLPSSFRISFAPELEYNISAKNGILTGIWFSVAGQNTSAFATYFLSYVHQF